MTCHHSSRRAYRLEHHQPDADCDHHHETREHFSRLRNDDEARHAARLCETAKGETGCVKDFHHPDGYHDPGHQERKAWSLDRHDNVMLFGKSFSPHNDPRNLSPYGQHMAELTRKLRGGK